MARMHLAGAALLLMLGTSLHAAQPRLAALIPTPALVASPLVFAANRGQADARTEFVARARDCTIALVSSDAIVSFGSSRRPVRLVFAGAADSKPQPLDRQNARVQYDGSTGSVPLFGRVRYPSTYRGVDVVYYGKHGELEFDLELAPGADLSAVRIHVDGADAVRIDSDGALRIATGANEIRIDAPIAYHHKDGSRAALATTFVLEGTSTVSVAVAPIESVRRVTI